MSSDIHVVNKVPFVLCSSRKLEKFVFPKTPLRRSSVCDDLAIREGKKGSHVRQLITQEYGGSLSLASQPRTPSSDVAELPAGRGAATAHPRENIRDPYAMI